MQFQDRKPLTINALIGGKRLSRVSICIFATYLCSMVAFG